MAEILGTEQEIRAHDGACLLDVYCDSLTGRPTRAVMQNTSSHGYRFYIGTTNRLTGMVEAMAGTQLDEPILAAVTALLIDMRDGGLVTDWMCGIEGT